jgi:PHS family inorganic phosphate transporter-like MFS transporter
LIIIITGTFAQSLAGNSDAASIISVLILWRFITGVGIGGDYPLSAVISSEFSSTRIRGRLMTTVFAAQGWGNFSALLYPLTTIYHLPTYLKGAVLVAYIIVTAYKKELLQDSPTHPNQVDYMWRLLIGLGCVPGAIALFFRLTIPETPRFMMDIERNVQQAWKDIQTGLVNGRFVVDADVGIQRVQAPKATLTDFVAYFLRWENLKVLIGTSYSWFALDVRDLTKPGSEDLNLLSSVR